MKVHAGSASTTGPALAPRPLGERHRLLVWLGDVVEEWKLPVEGDVLIGRGVEAFVRIEMVAISRQHARLTLAPGSVRLRDLNSQNGTRVNGERLVNDRPLVYGDIISLGEITAILAEDSEPAGVPKKAGRAAPPASLDDEQLFEFGDRTVLIADPAMKHVYTQLGRLARSDLSVLVRGETGTGKELAATALHFWSKRWNQPLVTINCAALPESIAESELFGHTRGAFSGASNDKPGLIESGNGGSVFLDEIGDLSLAVQGKLLRVLETRKVMRLGSVNERQIDIRVIAATHRDLETGVRDGWFRHDLYYRLNVALVALPPLRARKRDLPLLAARFLKDACQALGRPEASLTDDAMARLSAHGWPGNVRELKNLMDYIAAASPDNVVGPEHFEARLDAPGGAVATPGLVAVPAAAPANAAARSLADSTREHERASIEAALRETNGNKTRAAKLLGVPLRTFMEKVKRHGLS
ncbi:MAG TPA: sigma 54-interacting transcriptional regulator [Polyangia bacterium]|nr:sigma 54-interacting transcriptional regulator [Polyangia bacterium]